MIPFYSHLEKDERGTIIKGKEKLIKEHISGIENRVRKGFQRVNFKQLDLESLIILIVKMHDLGKYTKWFQEYLKTDKKHEKGYQNHSLIGAITAYNLLKDKNIVWALVSYYVIRYHHSSLSDIDNSYYDSISEKYNDRLTQIQAQYKDLIPKLDTIGNEVGLELKKEVLANQLPQLYNDFDDWLQYDDPSIEKYFLINYLFSMLIEGDKLDASRTELYDRKPIENSIIEKHLLEKSKKGGKANELRNEVRKAVINQLEKSEVLTTKIYTLTAPTGVGKTFIALDFAIKLRNRIPELKNAQIVYALPFINIIEQGFDEYQQALKDSCKILAHYQYADVFGKDTERNQNDEEKAYNKKLMELDTWQADIVITSYVQFLHTLIGYKNKILKKFNHLANAIVIMDEVQTLRLEHLPLIGAMLYFLSKYMNTRVVLMTATKPKILELAYREILSKPEWLGSNNTDSAIEPEPENWSIELLDGFENVYKKYKRTKVVPLIDLSFGEESIERDFIDKVLGKKWCSTKSCLIVVNKVNRCIELFNQIKLHLDEQEFRNPIYCLSTNIVPADRLYIIEKIKLDLKFGKNPILISTQVVEAGVDLDFDMGIRDLGPIDSIIQVAGRINRQSNPIEPEQLYLPLYVVDFGDCKKIYGEPTTTQATKALKGKVEFSEGDYLELVDEYFTIISSNDNSSFSDSRRIFEAARNLKYDGKKDSRNENSNTYVSDFEVIEERGDIDSVFVLSDNRAFEILEAFKALKNNKISKESFDKDFKKDFHQRIIAVPNYYIDKAEHQLISKRLNLKFDIDYLRVAEPEHYNPKTGFIRDSKIAETHTMML